MRWRVMIGVVGSARMVGARRKKKNEKGGGTEELVG
jgi:hypothetical protein